MTELEQQVKNYLYPHDDVKNKIPDKQPLFDQLFADNWSIDCFKIETHWSDEAWNRNCGGGDDTGDIEAPTTLKLDEQQRFVEYAFRQICDNENGFYGNTRGMVLWHSVGSGKTITAFNAIAQNFRNGRKHNFFPSNYIWISRESIKKNPISGPNNDVEKIKQFRHKDGKILINSQHLSYQTFYDWMIATQAGHRDKWEDTFPTPKGENVDVDRGVMSRIDIENRTDLFKDKVLIFDEAHNLFNRDARNTDKANPEIDRHWEHIFSYLKNISSCKILFLTATPHYISDHYRSSSLLSMVNILMPPNINIDTSYNSANINIRPYISFYEAVNDVTYYPRVHQYIIPYNTSKPLKFTIKNDQFSYASSSSSSYVRDATNDKIEKVVRVVKNIERCFANGKLHIAMRNDTPRKPRHVFICGNTNIQKRMLFAIAKRLAKDGIMQYGQLSNKAVDDLQNEKQNAERDANRSTIALLDDIKMFKAIIEIYDDDDTYQNKEQTIQSYLEGLSVISHNDINKTQNKRWISKFSNRSYEPIIRRYYDELLYIRTHPERIKSVYYNSHGYWQRRLNLFYFGDKGCNNNGSMIMTNSNLNSITMGKENANRKGVLKRLQALMKTIWNNTYHDQFAQLFAPKDTFRFLFIDSSYTEGLDIYDTDFLHILDEPSSKSLLIQTAGRIIRRCTHRPFMPISNYGHYVNIMRYQERDDIQGIQKLRSNKLTSNPYGNTENSTTYRPLSYNDVGDDILNFMHDSRYYAIDYMLYWRYMEQTNTKPNEIDIYNNMLNTYRTQRHIASRTGQLETTVYELPIRGIEDDDVKRNHGDYSENDFGL